MTGVPGWEEERVAYINRQMLKFLLQLKTHNVTEASESKVLLSCLTFTMPYAVARFRFVTTFLDCVAPLGRS